jgi:hypothetical protein
MTVGELKLWSKIAAVALEGPYSMDPVSPQLTPPRVPGVPSTQRSRVAILVATISVVLLAALTLAIWKHQADISARRAQAQARFDAITKQRERINTLEKRYDSIFRTYDSANADARTASRKRHDSSDDDIMKTQAKKELADVNVLQDQMSKARGSLDTIASAYAEALGEGPVAAFRSKSDQYVQTATLGLNRWWRAIQDITDSLVGETFPRSNIEQLYDESQDYETRATTQADELSRQWKQLDKQLQGRIDAAKRDLAAIR